MKKMLCILLAALTLVCCGCQDQNQTEGPDHTSFLDVQDFRGYLQQDVWACKEEVEGGWVRYKVLAFVDDYAVMFRLTQDPGESTAAMFVRMLTYTYTDGNVSCDGLMEFLVHLMQGPYVPGYDVQSYPITYDCDNGVISSDGESWQVNEDDTIVQDQYTYCMEDYTELVNPFDDALSEVSANRKAAFLAQYPSAATHKDVRYDPYGYLGKLFQVTGTIALDDYYNFDYRDMEWGLFCICMEPNGGSYSDTWYVYADRNTFQSLFETLKQGSKSNVILICKSEFPNSTKNGLVKLVDYYIP